VWYAEDAGARVRAYLDETVVPVLRSGMRELVRQKPEDPLQWLADYLVAHKP
jgi:protein dpy-30